MTLSENQILESFVPVYDAVPEKWEDARPFLVEQLKRVSNAVNVREIGWFLDEELLAGKSFIPGINNISSGYTSQLYRQVLRKVIDFGSLPAAGTKSVAHNISFTNNFTLIFLGAYATDPVGFNAIPIPFGDPTALANNVSLTMDAANINITVGINLSAYTRCFVTIEYLQEL
ncbi:MAG: hypothetical protein ABFD00_10615 [Chloroherpetonaceae bacterium]